MRDGSIDGNWGGRIGDDVKSPEVVGGEGMGASNDDLVIELDMDRVNIENGSAAAGITKMWLMEMSDDVVAKGWENVSDASSKEKIRQMEINDI